MSSIHDKLDAAELWSCLLISYDKEKHRMDFWGDNPPEGRARWQIVRGTLHDCEKFSQGFNDAEIQRPIGVWAVVLPASEVPPIGALVSVHNYVEQN